MGLIFGGTEQLRVWHIRVQIWYTKTVRQRRIPYRIIASSEHEALMKLRNRAGSNGRVITRIKMGKQVCTA
jgi:hypothetical protein